MLTDSQLTGILTAAARAHAAAAEKNVSMVPFLCQSAIQQLNLLAIQLWQVDEFDAIPLWQVVTKGQPLSIDNASLIAVDAGDVQSFPAPAIPGEETCEVCSLTSVQLAEASRIVILFRFPSGKLVEEDCLQLTDIIADIRRRELLDQLLRRNQKQQKIVNFLGELHETTHRDELMQVFVTDGVAATDFQRIAVAVRQSFGKWSVDAITGVDSIAERSEEIQRLNRLVSEAEKEGQTPGTVLPLSISGDWADAGEAVVFECDRDWNELDQRSAKLLASQMALALKQLPERRRSQQRTSKQSKKRIRSVGILGSLVVLCCLVFTWPADFKIRAYGQALPSQRQEIFAPERGVIQNVHIKHGEFVEAGAPLFDIYNDELQVLRETTNEELVTAKARQSALQTISPRGPGATVSDRGLPTSVELVELTKKIESLELQLSLIDQQLNSLQVTSPFDGYVFRERMQEELPGRPVQQGQYVLQIAAIDGPWELRLRVPEDEVRHLLYATEKSQQPLPVTFALETTPDVEHVTELDHFSETTDLDSFGVLSSLAICELKQEEIPDARFGAGVLAKVHCGTRSLGYQATRRLIEFWTKYSPF